MPRLAPFGQDDDFGHCYACPSCCLHKRQVGILFDRPTKFVFRTHPRAHRAALGGQGEEPKAPRDAAGYGSIRMITEARNGGFAARGREQMGSDTCSASRTPGTYFRPKAW